MSDRNVLVTGAGRGIGRAIALRFAREGYRIALAARSAEEIEAVAAEAEAAGGNGFPVSMDVSDLASVEAGMAGVLEHFDGRLDILVNNAGVFTIRPFRQMSPATWYRMLAVNLNGPFHVTFLAIEALERSDRGHVFNVGSVASNMPFEGSSAYCTTKYGLRGFSDVLRLELEPAGVRVSTVYPQATDTSIFDDVPGEWDRSAMNRPEDVADVVWEAYAAPRGEDVANLSVPER